MLKRTSSSVREFVILPTRGLYAVAPTSSQSQIDFLGDFGNVKTFAAAKPFAASVHPTFRDRLRAILEQLAPFREMSTNTPSTPLRLFDALFSTTPLLDSP